MPASLARRLAEQDAADRLTRTVREALDAADDGWNTIWDRGRAQATYSGGPRQRSRAFPLIRDRDEGRFYPFYEDERDLEAMRNKCRDLATFTSVSVGALLALRCYTMGGEWDYKPVAKADAQEQPSPELLKEVAVIVKAILDRNNFIGDLDGEIHDCSREDGEALVAGYVTSDGLTDFRRLEVENLRAPANPGPLNRWLEIPDREASWTFGVHTVLDERMRRIDHERHAGYHCVFVDGGAAWDYLPAWPQSVGDRDLDGKFLHQIKRNAPRKAKRGISDFWPVLDDLERGKKLAVNLSVGAAVLAAIPWIETFPKGTTRDQAQNQLSRAMDTFSRSLTNNRGGERQVLNLAPGTPLRVSQGKEYTAGPMGQVRQPVYIEVYQHICRSIGLRWLMPEYMISGDASNANYASTLVAESPFVKAREGDQQFYVSHFKLLLLKALKLATDAGRFRRYGVQSWAHFLAMVDLAIQPPMVASRDKAQQLAELRDLWAAGLIDGNEYRIDLKREPKPELEGKTGGGPSPLEMQAALAQAGAGQPGQQPPDDPNSPPGKGQVPPKPPQPPEGKGKNAPSADREEQTRAAAFGKAVAEARSIDEARALGRAILESRRVRECGANAPGGGGFQAGNNCAGEGGPTSAAERRIADAAQAVQFQKAGEVSGETPMNTWVVSDAGEAALQFQTPSGRTFTARIQEFSDGGIRAQTFDFKDDLGKYGVTGKGEAFPVFNSATAAIVAYVRERNPEILHFSAEEESRKKLYNLLLAKGRKLTAGYGAGYSDLEGTRHYALFKPEHKSRLIEGMQKMGGSFIPTQESAGDRPQPAFVEVTGNEWKPEWDTEEGWADFDEPGWGELVKPSDNQS